MRLALARTLAWSLLMAGWLELGALGHAAWPLTAAGLLPVAAWLAVIGLAQHALRERRLGTAALRAWVVSGAALASSGLLFYVVRPQAASIALPAAALGWGALVVAASRCVRALRRGPAPLPVVPAALGTALAWLATSSATTCAFVIAAAALALAALVPSGMVVRGCRTGLFDCVLPSASAWPRDAPAWLHAAVRWAMLPMMATLAAMGDWCSASLALGPRAVIGLHLAAMLLPPLALHLAGIRLRHPAWVALPLGIAALLPLAQPLGLAGLGSLAGASLACALAWGLAWHEQGGRPVPVALHPPPDASRLAALVPAAAVAAIGIALEHQGPAALGWAITACALVAAVGGTLTGPVRRPA